MLGELQQQQGIDTRDLRSGDATLTLRRGIVVSGKVAGPGGESINKGLVVWSDNPYLAEGVNETAIDGDGRYKTKHLAPGKYSITVLVPGFAPWQKSIEVNQDLDQLDIQLELGHSLRIKFVDQMGRPIPNVYVGIGKWRGAEAIFNQNHPNVPDSGIPRLASDDGVYDWDWSPDDAVSYHISAEGFAGQEVTLVAKPAQYVITLAPERMAVGTVTMSTGKPIERFLAMPVIVFRPDFYHTCTADAKGGQEGRYELPLTDSADPNVRYRVRFEAEGYRSVVSEESFGPLDGRATLDVALQPTPVQWRALLTPKANPSHRPPFCKLRPQRFRIPQTANQTLTIRGQYPQMRKATFS